MGETKRKKRIALYFKRAAVAMLVMTMLLQQIPGTVGSSVQSVEAAITTGDYIDLEQTLTELYQGDTWSGSSATMGEVGAKTTVTVDNFGHGGSNEWGIQYMVKDLGLKNSTKYLVEFDITSSIDKEIFIKLDDVAELIAEPLNLTAGTTYHYSKESVAGTLSTDKQFLYFALGRKGSEADGQSGTITIENVRVDEIKDTETAVDITVNKKGTNIKFQLAKDATIVSAKAYYTICASEAEANALSVGDAAFKECTMAKKSNGIWEVSDAVALTDGQIIRYYFDKDGQATIPVNYAFSSFTAVDYTYDNQADLVTAGYNLAWSDEFEGAELDPNKWSFQIGTKDPNGGPEYWGNEEKEYYTDSNHVVSGGALFITAKKETMEGMPYTSTRIRTKTDDGDTLYATKYGRIEARMKLPTEEGLWPAFWMLPVDASIYGTWAASGELDILEARGRVPDKVGGTIHFGSQWPNNTYYGKEQTLDSSTDIGAYHLYSVEWEPGKITWLVDDVPYFTTDNFWSKDSGNAENYAYGAPFDVPYYIIFNLAVGGTFDGTAKLENAQFPADMEVDYVRVYKKSDAYYQNLEDNLTTPENDRDVASFESLAYQPTGVNGDYVKDTEFNTLETVAEVNPDDTDWQYFVGDFGGEATIATDTTDGTAYAKASITKGGNQNYAIQLIKHFPFAKGYTYEISFDGKASVGREFLLKPCGDADNGWTGYGVSKTVSLTSTMTHYTHQFTMDKDSDPTARLEFDLGLATGDVWIGNVVVKQVETETVDITDIFKDPDQNGGNHIYNGSFDQGTGRLGFWHKENVTVKVPSVINPEYDVATGDKGDYSYRAFVTAGDSNGKIYQNGIWLQQSDIYQLNLNLSSQTATKVSAVLTNKDGTKVYMKQTLDVTGGDIRKDYTVNFAMSKGVTDKEAVFALLFEKGSIVSIDNLDLIRTTNNNVSIDYSDVDLEPVKTDSTEWINNLNNGTVSPAANEDGEITSQTVTDQLNYMSMLYVPVKVQKGITYHLSFQAKSQYDNSVMVNTQEDNTWAVIFEENLNMKAEEWQDFNVTFHSTLTNGSNPIFLKFLLSGPNVIAGTFKVKNVSMVTEVQEGAKDAPADTIINSSPPVKGSDYVIALKDGDYKTKFLNNVEKPDRKALIMVNGSALPDGSIKNGRIVIPASIIGTGAYTIELALDGFNSIALSGIVKDVTNSGNNPSNNPESNTGNDNEKITDAAAPVIVTQPVGGKYGYNTTAASLSVKATGDGTVSYQWYKNTSNTTTGASVINGATGAKYAPSTAKAGKIYYYCVVTNTDKEATGVKYATTTTNLVTVEVTKAANTITGVSNISKVYGSAAFTLSAKAKGTITYKSSNPKVVTVASKSGKVVIKGTGKATITITAAGNGNYKTSTKKITVTVTPKKVTVTSIKSSKANNLTVAWKKDTKVTGYKIQYSTSSDFSHAKTATVYKNATTTKTISKLRGGKTYYVRVRAYTKYDTIYLTGSWSAAKKVVVKK